MTPRQPILGVFSYSKVFVKSHTNFGISQFYTYHLWYVPAERGIFIYQKWYLCTKIGISHIPKLVSIYHKWYYLCTKNGIYTNFGINFISKIRILYTQNAILLRATP